MDEPILFNPDNRLLGGGAGDLSLFGGQADPQISIQQTQGDAPAVLDGAATVPSASVEDQVIATEGGATVSVSATAPTGEVDGAGSLASASFLITAPDAPFAPVSLIEPLQVATNGAEFHVAAQGAGLPVPVTEPVNTAPTADAMVSESAATLLDHLAGPGHDGDPTAGVAGLIAPIGDLADGVLSTTVSVLDDTLDGLAGGNPLAGIATLVNMVSTSDVFDLSPVEGLVTDVADTGLGLVDALAGEELLPDNLLGAHDDHGLLGGDHALDHPLGL